MATGEVWEPVVGYEGLYEVSNTGKLRNAHKETVKPFPNAAGYYRVNLCRNGERKAKFVHRLVAEAFIDNAFGYPQVNHKDENRANNAVENLEWCSAEYNTNYGTRNQRASESMKLKNCKPVIATNERTGEEICFLSATFAAALIGKCKSYIGYAAKHPRKVYSGYMWRYADGC